MPITVLVPFLNPNEPEARIVSLLAQQGGRVAKGDVLCTLETTKSTVDVVAETDGYVIGLKASEGQTVRAGEVLCYLAVSPDESAPERERTSKKSETPEDDKDIPEGLRITAPALAFARKVGIDLKTLPTGALITEPTLRKLFERAWSKRGETALPSTFNAAAILVYGGGGHGKMIIELVRGVGEYQIAGIVDDGLPAGEQVLGVTVLGAGEILPVLKERGLRMAANAVGGIGNIPVRLNIFKKLSTAGFVLPTLIHNSAILEPSAELSPGAQVFANAYIGSLARLGFGVIVNTGAIVSHDCMLEDFAIISPGAMLAGEVNIGKGALVGMGVTVNVGVRVGPGARLGNGATVKDDVPEGGIVRAGLIWPG